MSNQPGSVLERLRRPEYTGENRCPPCTAVNVVLALVIGSVLVPLSPPLAVITLLASLAAIYLRGYLVPGTPELTKRYLPGRILALFDESPLEEHANDGTWETVERIERERENAVDPEAFLLEAGAVEPCEHEADLCLSAGFTERFDDRAADYDGSIDRGTLADVFGTDPDSIAMLDREYPAIEIDRRIRKWPSEAALIADLAADDALHGLTDRWSDVPLEQRLGILKSLRSFHERCPRCSGPVYLHEETAESCCRSYEVIAIGCEDCGDPLLEFNPDELDLPADETTIEP